MILRGSHIYAVARGHLAQTERSSILQRILPQIFEQSAHFLVNRGINSLSLDDLRECEGLK
jgi:hypothetical protein